MVINWLVPLLDNFLAGPGFWVVVSLLLLELDFVYLDCHLRLGLALVMLENPIHLNFAQCLLDQLL